MLWKFYNDSVEHIQILKDLDLKGCDQYGIVPTPVGLSYLAPDLHLEWSPEENTHKSDLKFLLDFMQEKIG